LRIDALKIARVSAQTLYKKNENNLKKRFSKLVQKKQNSIEWQAIAGIENKLKKFVCLFRKLFLIYLGGKQ